MSRITRLRRTIRFWCRKLSEFRFRRKANRIRNPRADRKGHPVSAGSFSPFWVIAALGLRRFKDALPRSVDPSLTWKCRMPPLHERAPARLTVLSRVWVIVLHNYHVVAAGLVLVRKFWLATARG